MFERFTDRARRVVVLAQQQAASLDHNYVGTEHLLLGLAAEGGGVAATALTSLEVTADAVRAEVESQVGRGPGPPEGHLSFTPGAKRVLELALHASMQSGHAYIGTGHLLLGVIREGQSLGAQVLAQLAGGLDAAGERVMQLLADAADAAAEASTRTETTAATVETARMSGERPRCRSCMADLSAGVRVGTVPATAEEAVSVTLVWCPHCGAAVGVLPGRNR